MLTNESRNDPHVQRLMSLVVMEMERQSRMTGDAAPPAGWLPHIASTVRVLSVLHSQNVGHSAGRRVEMLVRVAAFAIHWAAAILKYGHQE